MKSGYVVFEICERNDGHADRNFASPAGGEVKNSGSTTPAIVFCIGLNCPFHGARVVTVVWPMPQSPLQRCRTAGESGHVELAIQRQTDGPTTISTSCCSSSDADHDTMITAVIWQVGWPTAGSGKRGRTFVPPDTRPRRYRAVSWDCVSLE